MWCQIVLAGRNYQSELTGRKEPGILSESFFPPHPGSLQNQTAAASGVQPPPPIYQHSFYRNPTSYSILWEPAGGMKGIKYWEGGKNIKSSLITSSLPLQKWSERKFYLGNTSFGISLRVLSGYCTAKHSECLCGIKVFSPFLYSNDLLIKVFKGNYHHLSLCQSLSKQH